MASGAPVLGKSLNLGGGASFSISRKTKVAPVGLNPLRGDSGGV